jgi:hypothetical protein
MEVSGQLHVPTAGAVLCTTQTSPHHQVIALSFLSSPLRSSAPISTELPRHQTTFSNRFIYIYIYIPCILIINYSFQQMHYTILVFSCPYICFDTYSAIFRGVVKSSQFSNASNSLSQHKFTFTT